MPFQWSLPIRKLLKQQRRTGEPSPAYHFMFTERDKGRGKAHGSYTETMREALFQWRKDRGDVFGASITFQYRLSRKRIVTITGRYPYLYHDPLIGTGKQGFVLRLRIMSIDGLAYKPFVRLPLSWNRIVGHIKMLALPEKASKEERRTPWLERQVAASTVDECYPSTSGMDFSSAMNVC